MISEDKMKLYMHPASITSRIVRLYIAEKNRLPEVPADAVARAKVN
jgi:hypothetical protein